MEVHTDCRLPLNKSNQRVRVLTGIYYFLSHGQPFFAKDNATHVHRYARMCAIKALQTNMITHSQSIKRANKTAVNQQTKVTRQTSTQANTEISKQGNKQTWKHANKQSDRHNQAHKELTNRPVDRLTGQPGSRPTDQSCAHPCYMRFARAFFDACTRTTTHVPTCNRQ